MANKEIKTSSEISVETAAKVDKQDADNSTTELVAIDPSQLLQQAIQSKASVEALEKLMDLQERWEKNKARKMYHQAMADFQSECPVIVKSNSGGVTKEGVVAYRYAPMDVILLTRNHDKLTVKDLISRNGFSYTFNVPETNEKGVYVEMTITHIAGHSEVIKQFMPMVIQTGVMSPPQVVASTRTYAIRYAFMNGFGIATGDEDNDAQAREFLDEQFNGIVNDWESNAKIKQLAEKIESVRIYRDFISKLPKPEDMKRFRDVLMEINPTKRRGVWEMFESAVIAMKWQRLLDNLEAKLAESKQQNQETKPIDSSESTNSENPV